jgi:hypothetical protein
MMLLKTQTMYVHLHFGLWELILFIYSSIRYPRPCPPPCLIILSSISMSAFASISSGSSSSLYGSSIGIVPLFLINNNQQFIETGEMIRLINLHSITLLSSSSCVLTLVSHLMSGGEASECQPQVPSPSSSYPFYFNRVMGIP